MKDLPVNWVQATLGNVATFEMGQAPPGSASNFDGVGTPFVKAGEFGPTRPLIREWTTDPKKFACATDVLVCVVGATAGKVNLGADCAIGRSVAAVRPGSAILQQFLYYKLLTQVIELRAGSTGSAQGVISREMLASVEVELPPLNEQRRIVAKLDALNEKTSRAKEALEAVPPLLEKLRQSILAAAFRGDLTKAWRAQNPNAEPASKLLERIRAERRRRWEEAELEKLKAKGKLPKDDRWKEKYEEPAPVDAEGLPELPEGWCWTRLDSLCDADRGVPYGIVLTGDPFPGGVPTVRCGDIKEFSIDLRSLKLVHPSISAEYQRTVLAGGEVLLAIRGTVGATARAVPEMAGMNISREVAMIPVLSGLDADFLTYSLASPMMQEALGARIKGVAQAGINLSDLRALPVAVPSIHEQVALVRAVKDCLKALMALNARLVETQGSFDGLTSSVLTKAFMGELVPQDPSDEPASVLLDRLRTEVTPAASDSARQDIPKSAKRSRAAKPRKAKAS
jgi:type I restriction enzyme, S subunit